MKEMKYFIALQILIKDATQTQLCALGFEGWNNCMKYSPFHEFAIKSVRENQHKWGDGYECVEVCDQGLHCILNTCKCFLALFVSYSGI